jgi:uracil-DNA glycosylase family 4
MPWQDRIRDPDCTLCPLHAGAQHVCLMGTGSRKVEVMIVGEAPGEREDDEHAAFVGPSGSLLRRALREEAGLDEDDYYVTNVVKCRPPGNDTPSKSDAKVCGGEYLARELRAISPRIVLALGNTPLTALLARSGITKHRGTPVESPDGYVVLPTFHPAYCLRSPQHEPTFRADLQRLGRMVRGESSSADKTRIKLVRTKSQLLWLRRRLDEAPLIYFDLETSSEGTGKDHRYHKPWDPSGQIVMAGFTWEEGLGVAVPLHHAESPWRDPDAVLRFLKPPLEDKTKKLGAHNGKFDCTWLASKGVYVRQTFDTMLAAHILDENRLKGLKPLSQILLGVDAYDVGEELKDAYNMALRRLSIYQAKDVDYGIRLYWIFRQQLLDEPRLKRVFQRIMMPASNELVKVETVGLYTIEANLKKQLRLKEKERDKVEAKMRSYLPVEKRETLNFRSPQQVAQWFFGDLGLSIVKKTKKGAPSTDEDVMLTLAKQHPAAKLLLRYRTLETKDIRTYLRSWDEKRDARDRVHTNYKLFGTVTGRLSSEKPNLQQVPRESSMRTCFGAPEGWAFVEADYSQVELRIAAMLSRDPTLLRIFATGGDPHLTTAAEVSGLSEAEVKRSDATGKTEWRKKAKPVNFGFLYGMGEQKFIDYARVNYGVDVTEKEAHRYRTRYFNLYSELLRWHDRQRRLVKSLGRVHSPLGRVRHLPDVHSGDKKVRGEAERQAINSPVQSMASDLMLLSLVWLSQRLDPRRSRIVGTVHDAILFEIANSYVAEAAPIIKEVMEDMHRIEKMFNVEITVPIVVEIKAGQYWGAGKVLNV